MTKQARRGWRQARSDTIASTAKTRRDKPGRSGIPDHSIDRAARLATVRAAAERKHHNRN